MKYKLLWICFFLITGTYSTSAQLSLETFGKNRVETKRIQWKYYESERFRVYYYDRGGAELARYVAEQADKDVRAMEKTMNSNFPNMLNIILYNSFDHYEQSNVGFNTELEVSDRVAGNVKVAGERIVIYFNGRHNHLKKQIREGMARVIMERALFGNDIKSFARNVVAQKIPEWTSLGYIDYVVFGWDADAEETWKQYLKKEKVYFQDLVDKDPQLAGKAFWKYIADTRSVNEVRTLYYYIVQKNNLNTALNDKYGLKEKHIHDTVIKYFQDRYRFEAQLSENPHEDTPFFTIIAKNDDVKIKQIKVSPRGGDIAYVEWEHGLFNVILEKTRNQKGTIERVKSSIFRGGVKDHEADPDQDYPILAWSNTGFKLAIVYKHKQQLKIRVFDAIKAEVQNYTIRTNRFDRIQGVTFMDDDAFIVFSGISNGKSDLFEYHFRTRRLQPITEDQYDDLNPIFIMGGSRKGIAFISNRPVPHLNINTLPNELPTGPMNAFFYDVVTKRSELLQLTNTQGDHISEIIPYGHDHFAYLSDASGINNRYVVLFARDENNIDTPYSVAVTNYGSSIVSHQYNPASAKVGEVIQDGRNYKVYFRPMQLPQPIGPLVPKEPLQIQAVEIDAQNNQVDTGEYTIGNYIQFKVNTGNTFLSEFDYTPQTSENSNVSSSHSDTTVQLKDESELFAKQMEIAPADATKYVDNITAEREMFDSLGRKIMYVDSTYIRLKSNNYHRAFFIESFSAQLDNSILFNKYQSYSGNGGQIDQPQLGGFTTIKLRDRLEDHRITAGIKASGNINLSYLLKYENLKRRLDWGITGFMQNGDFNQIVGLSNGSTVIPYEVKFKERMTILQLNLNYPLSRTQSIRGTFGYRQDKTWAKATNLAGILVPTLNENYSMNKIEFVQDDSRMKAINISEGLRFKVFSELYYKFSAENDFYSDGNGTLNNKSGYFFTAGFDIRNYKQIYRNLTLALRAAGAHSGGTQQVMYILGGVDNQLNASNNGLLLPSLENTYAFQTMATNMRGYKSNARNGNTYAVINAELRMPVWHTLTRKPTSSDFLKNLQLIAFVDVGSAWEGLIPDHQLPRSNVFYYPDILNPLVTVKVPYPDPTGLALGYGLGMRFYLYSYFWRFDFARNIENKNMIHVSMGFDF